MISNAANRPLFSNCGTNPDVSGALLDTLQPMMFTRVVKTILNFQVHESPQPLNFLGNWQPFTERQLLLKPEGQRAWSWFLVHADPSLKLTTDEIITYLGVQYRVMALRDYSLNGFMIYHLIEDFVGAGPV